MKPVYIVKAYRTPVGKALKGGFRFTRPDVLASKVIEQIISELPDFDTTLIDDLIVGNAMPEAEQGLNFARLISLMALDSDKVSGMTVNRYCASGLETIAIGTAKIATGMSDCILAGGSESMSYIPMGGYKPVPEFQLAKEHADYYWGMGLTAEAVAKQFKVSREDQDEFAYHSHRKALSALENNAFEGEIVPITVAESFYKNGKEEQREYVVSKDEGPRVGTNVGALNKLKPVFATDGSVTAGNSSQMSDGSSFLMFNVRIYGQKDQGRTHSEIGCLCYRRR